MIIGSNAAMEVVGEAADARGVVEVVRHEAPDMILMDTRDARSGGHRGHQPITSFASELRTRL